jgi:hypothetical protein
LTFLNLKRFIEEKEVREFVEESLLLCKEEFFYLPSSQSGLYHPEYALGIGGLVRHTKAAMIIAEELIVVHPCKDKDLIMAALALHDIEKPSKLHPKEVKLRLEPLREDYYFIFSRVMPLIESHMGQWDEFGKLPTPKTKAQRFVHMCDYLASRKEIQVYLL